MKILTNKNSNKAGPLQSKMADIMYEHHSPAESSPVFWEQSCNLTLWPYLDFIPADDPILHALTVEEAGNSRMPCAGEAVGGVEGGHWQGED